MHQISIHQFDAAHIDSIARQNHVGVIATRLNEDAIGLCVTDESGCRVVRTVYVHDCDPRDPVPLTPTEAVELQMRAAIATLDALSAS